MKVGLHDAEYERSKCKKFPNYALMKLSAWHKQNGDDVELFIPKDPNAAEQLSFFANADDEYPPKHDAYTYDIVYSSKVFGFTPENPFLPPTAIKGGTGYGIFTELPPEVDAMFPDYSIYPDCDYAIGYITRGCPNNCRWCVVPKKEGNIHAYRDWHDLVRPDSDKLVLMDNNVLACDYGLKQLETA